jgi:hypothetical protein
MHRVCARGLTSDPGVVLRPDPGQLLGRHARALQVVVVTRPRVGVAVGVPAGRARARRRRRRRPRARLSAGPQQARVSSARILKREVTGVKTPLKINTQTEAARTILSTCRYASKVPDLMARGMNASAALFNRCRPLLLFTFPARERTLIRGQGCQKHKEKLRLSALMRVICSDKHYLRVLLVYPCLPRN